MNVTPPLTPLPTTNEFKCVVCEKQFTSSRSLSRHKNTIQKYNEIFAEEKIPDFLVNKFKEDIIYLIHRRLNKNSKNVGLQTISITCPRSLFKAIFNYLLRTGIEWVKRVKIPGNWQGALQDKAKETWSKIIDPKADD